MVETAGEGVPHAQGAAEAHAAEHRELAPPLEQQADDLEEILVPAHGDAVFRDAAEAGHHAAVEILAQLPYFLDGLERHPVAERIDARHRRLQRLDLQAVDGDHGVPVVHQVVRQRESRRAEPDHKDSFPGCRFWIRAANVEGVPAREQRVDLEAPGQLEHVLQRARLGLRDVDRLLLLVDAGFHAVVADAVPGGGQHRVVDGDDAERRERLAARLDHVKLGDLLLERAAGQRDAEHGLAECPGGRLFLEAFRARVLSLLVAPDAVVRLVERADQVGAAIGQLESVALAQVLRGMLRKAILGFAVNRDQPHVVELSRRLEQHAGAVLLASLGTRRSPRCVARGGFELRCMRCFVLQPVAHLSCKLQFRERPAEQLLSQCIRVDAGGVFHFVQRTPLHELALHRVKRCKLVVFLRERAGLRFDAEELRQEILDLRRERDQQV